MYIYILYSTNMHIVVFFMDRSEKRLRRTVVVEKQK